MYDSITFPGWKAFPWWYSSTTLPPNYRYSYEQVTAWPIAKPCPHCGKRRDA